MVVYEEEEEDRPQGDKAGFNLTKRRRRGILSVSQFGTTSVFTVVS